jgi:hypothetical protein
MFFVSLWFSYFWYVLKGAKRFSYPMLLPYLQIMLHGKGYKSYNYPTRQSQNDRLYAIADELFQMGVYPDSNHGHYDEKLTHLGKGLGKR